MADRLRRYELRNRCGVLEGLGRRPRLAGFLGFRLQVAAREIDADGVSVDMVERFLDGNVGAAAAQGDDQFNLVVDIGGTRRVGEVLARRQQVVRIF